jgi:hypothetical protein
VTVAVDVDADPPIKPLPGPHKKDKTNQEQWGLNFLVCRKKNGITVGYQATCNHPLHRVDGTCTKELRASVVDGHEAARRVLKAWLLFGLGCDSRAEHMDRNWKNTLLDNLESGFLPSEAQLDLLTITNWNADVDVPVEMSLPENFDKEHPLGEAADGVPPGVHAEMEKLAIEGWLQPTSLAQRARNKPSSGTAYGVPVAWASARDHGYIHPNLPPPHGMRWVFRKGSFVLLPRAG